MKKFIAITLCALMALSFTACSKDVQKEDVNNQTKNQVIGDENLKIPNPFIETKTIEEAEKLAGFTVNLPKTIPAGYTQKTIESVKDEMIQIAYEKGEDTIIFRQGKGGDDISGDYNEYDEIKTIKVGSLQVTTRGNNGKVNVATWVDGEYAYAVSVGFDEAGIDEGVITDMVSNIG